LFIGAGRALQQLARSQVCFSLSTLWFGFDWLMQLNFNSRLHLDGYWKDVNNVRQFFENIAPKLGVKEVVFPCLIWALDLTFN
jgi:hypothetical protein